MPEPNGVSSRRGTEWLKLCDYAAAVGALVAVAKWRTQPRRCFLRYADRLNDLEYRGTAHDKDEQGQQPRTHRVLLVGALRRFRHVATHRDVLAGLLVGDFDSLLGSHYYAEVLCCTSEEEAVSV